MFDNNSSNDLLTAPPSQPDPGTKRKGALLLAVVGAKLSEGNYCVKVPNVDIRLISHLLGQESTLAIAWVEA